MPKDRGEFRSEMPTTAERPATSVEAPNATLVRDLLDAFNRGDVDHIVSKMADKVVWRFPGKNVLAGDYQGKEGVRAFLMKPGAETNGTIKPTLIAALGDADHGVLFIRTTGDRKGKHLDMKEVLVFTIEDGLVTEVIHRPDPAATDDVFA